MGNKKVFQASSLSASKIASIFVLVIVFVAFIALLALIKGYIESSRATKPTLTPTSTSAPTPTLTPTPDPEHQFTRTKSIIFAGKVVNRNSNEWPNNRIVVLYLKQKEVARTETSLGEFQESGLGPIDGLFVISTDNLYGLTMEILNQNPSSEIDFFYGEKWNLLSRQDYLYHWFGDVEEGSQIKIPISNKNIEYTLVILSGDKDSLPAEILSPGTTELRTDGRIVAFQPNPHEGDVLMDPSQNIFINSVKYGVREEPIELRKISFPVDNCQATTDNIQTFNKTQSYTSQYKTELGVGIKIPLPVWTKLLAELQAKYGFEQGQVNSESFEYTMTTRAGEKQTYIYTWKEVWESGTSVVNIDGQTYEYPFKVKKGLIIDVVVQSQNCP